MLRASLRAKLGQSPCARQLTSHQPQTRAPPSATSLHCSSIPTARPCKREQCILRAWQVTKALPFALLPLKPANRHHRTCASTFIHCSLCLEPVSTIVQLVFLLAYRTRIATTTALDRSGTCLQRRAPSAKPPKNLPLSMEMPTSRPQIARLGRDGWRWNRSPSVTFYTHITVTIY